MQALPFRHLDRIFVPLSAVRKIPLYIGDPIEEDIGAVELIVVVAEYLCGIIFPALHIVRKERQKRGDIRRALEAQTERPFDPVPDNVPVHDMIRICPIAVDRRAVHIVSLNIDDVGGEVCTSDA